MPTRVRCRVVLSILGVVLLAAGPSAADPIPSGETVAPGLVPPGPDGRLPVLLRTPFGPALASRVEELGGQVLHVFENAELVAALLPPESVPELQGDARVEAVVRQRWIHRAITESRLPGFPEPRLRDRGREFLLPGDARALHTRTLAVAELRDPTPQGGDLVSFLGYEPIIGAGLVGADADWGEGTIVAIIDTGVYDAHPLFQGNVIGGMNLVPEAEEMAIDLDHDGSGDGRHFDWNRVENNGHGTFVAGLIAGHAWLDVPESERVLQSVLEHSPESVQLDGQGGAQVYLAGTAPAASLYGVKVFPYDGGPAPDARVAEALDRLITMKKDGTLDVNVVNMSLSGPVLYDGKNPLDQLVDTATFHGITCVVAASNDGPSQVTVGSPGSAVSALTVAAALDPIHTRVAIEQFFPGPIGTGTVLFPHEDPQVVDFSSRGLTADLREKPDILATGFFAFSSTLEDFSGDGVNDTPFYGFGSGTSFSTPTVAGAAALLTAYARIQGRSLDPPRVANTLMASAEPIADFDTVGRRHQGKGFVDLPAAFALVKNRARSGDGDSDDGSDDDSDDDSSDDSSDDDGDPPGNPHPMQQVVTLQNGHAEGECPPLAPGESFDFFVPIPSNLWNLHVSFPTVGTPGPPNPLVGDGLEVSVHTAKRGGAGDYVFGAAPVTPGDSFDFRNPGPGGFFRIPEPGTVRITMSSIPLNYGAVFGSFEIDATPYPHEPTHEIRGVIRRDGVAVHTVDVREGLDALAVRLIWKHDWREFPTYDLDLFVQAPDGMFPVASLDSPEFAWIEYPAAGEWTFVVTDFSTVRGDEAYALEVAEVAKYPRRSEVVPDLPRPRVISTTPNPATPATTVVFELPSPGRTRLEVYNVAGRLVRSVLDEDFAAGTHQVAWDGRSTAGRAAADGVYFVRLRTESGSSTRKVLLKN